MHIIPTSHPSSGYPIPSPRILYPFPTSQLTDEKRKLSGRDNKSEYKQVGLSKIKRHIKTNNRNKTPIALIKRPLIEGEEIISCCTSNNSHDSPRKKIQNFH